MNISEMTIEQQQALSFILGFAAVLIVFGISEIIDVIKRKRAK